MKKNTNEKSERQAAYIRCDGWVISAEGMERLVKSGHKGHKRFMESIEGKIGEWRRVCKPLDRDAAAIVKSVKGMVARALFVSQAIVNEAMRRAENGKGKGKAK